MSRGLFVGVEAEGRFKGLRTLFCPGDQWAGRHLDVIDMARKHECAHVYVAAAKTWVQDWVEAADFIWKCRHNNLVVTVEHPLSRAVEIPIEVYSIAHIILSVGCVIAGSIACMDVEIKVEDQTTALLYGRPQIVPLDYLTDHPV